MRVKNICCFFTCYLGPLFRQNTVSYFYTDGILEYDEREMTEINVEIDLKTEETK